MQEKAREDIKDYYGRVLKSKEDLQTTACCIAEAYPSYIKEIRSKLPAEVLNKFYGCGSPIPPALEGCHVLDLGCGTGHDVFVLSKLVGESGSVTGLDMTQAQLEVALSHEQEVMKAFGYSRSNVNFKQAYIEDLSTAGIESESMDLVVSNCVLNLSPDKCQVFSEIFRALKTGGELYFSDVFADRRVPKELFEDPEVLGECLGGAMYFEDFRRMMISLGCPDHRVVSISPLEITNERVRKKTGNIKFYSATIRAFKLETLEDRCEDYGQSAIYRGELKESPHSFLLDNHHVFQKAKPMLVCGNTASMLTETRFAKHFEVIGDRQNHYGLFDCGSVPSLISTSEQNNSGACC